MATFSAKTFNASDYASFRPTYHGDFFRLLTVFGKHRSPSFEANVALDLGCGTGQVTQSLLASESYPKVIAVDPSETMITQAKNALKGYVEAGRLECIVTSAEGVDEKLSHVSIDLVTAGQAAHWFNFGRLWPALEQVVRPGGVVAFWGYAIPVFTGYPEAHKLIHSFAFLEDLAPFWQQPGIDILEREYRDLVFPASERWDSGSATRLYFEGGDGGNKSLPYYSLSAILDGHERWPAEKEWRTDPITTKRFTWEILDAYLHTWSAVHSYHERYPEDKVADGGDIVTRFVKGLRIKLGVDVEHFDLYWPVYVMLIRRGSA